MTSERITVSIPADLLAAARAEVERGEAPNMSAYVSEALTRRVRSMQHARRLQTEWEAEHGPLPAEAVEWAEHALGLNPGEQRKSA